jgi:hypothetical protein
LLKRRAYRDVSGEHPGHAPAQLRSVPAQLTLGGEFTSKNSALNLPDFDARLDNLSMMLAVDRTRAELSQKESRSAERSF